MYFQDDEIPKDGKYDVDGSYVPRIVFLGNLKMLKLNLPTLAF